MEKYTRQDLQSLLDTPELLASLYQITHPQAQHNLQTLIEKWATNRAIARIRAISCPSLISVERILTREDEIKQARKTTEEKLLETKELEKQWQQKQSEMDQAMKVPTSRKNIN